MCNPPLSKQALNFNSPARRRALRPTKTDRLSTGALAAPSAIKAQHARSPVNTRYQSLDKTCERECHFSHRHDTTESGAMVMKKHNVGVVGYGWVATDHIPAMNATSLGQDEEMPLTSLDDVVISLKAVFAAERSARLGRPVKMSELNSYAK